MSPLTSLISILNFFSFPPFHPCPYRAEPDHGETEQLSVPLLSSAGGCTVIAHFWKRTANNWKRLESSMNTTLIHQRGLSSGFHTHRCKFRTPFQDDAPLHSYLPKRISEPCLTELLEELESSKFGDGAAIEGYNGGERYLKSPGLTPISEYSPYCLIYGK